MDSPTSFIGSIADNYEKYMVPIFFEPYSNELTDRLPSSGINSLLDIACGTGQVTRAIHEKYPDVKITATDLNPDMIAVAGKQSGEDANIAWQTADAQELPFKNNEFDCAVCQFGLMFVPDKQKAVNEAYRVLKSGGKFIFNTWDSMKNNHLNIIANEVTNSFFPDNPITFWNVPFSMYDPDEMKSLMNNAGFKDVNINLVSVTGHSESASNAALALTTGTPIYASLCERDKDVIPSIIDKLTDAISKEYGETDLSFPLNAWFIEGMK